MHVGACRVVALGLECLLRLLGSPTVTDPHNRDFLAALLAAFDVRAAPRSAPPRQGAGPSSAMAPF
jgi:hypothetical protein